MKKLSKLLLPVLLITFLSTILIAFFSKSSLFDTAEMATYDFRIQYFSPPSKISDRIVMIWIDEDTIKGLPYRSPVPRDFLAKLNEKLENSNPLLIAYDIFFQDPTVADYDETLAQSFSKGRVYSVSAGVETTNDKIVEEKPLGLFQNSLTGFALSDLPLNAYDAKVRKFEPFRIINGVNTPTFAASLYNAVSGNRAASILEETSLNLFGFIFHPYKKSQNGEIKASIRYAGPPCKIGGENNTFTIFPANLVAAGMVPENWLRNKIILVGSAYKYSQDAFLTPYFGKKYNYAQMNGVEIHANILNSLLENEFYYIPDFTQKTMLLFLTALIISIISLNYPLLRSCIIGMLLLIIFFLLTIWTFNRYALVLPLIAPISAVLISFGLSLAWRSVTEGKQKRFIRGVFARYVPATVVEQMLSDPSKLVLGGETREITSLFTDIESFTTISEHLQPHILVSFLNEYLNEICNVIFKYDGTIDKFEGDAVIAFFGAPIDLDKHEEAAIKAALEIQNATKDISEKWKSICGREIITRVGINSGPAVVGNMGNEGRFDYTAIGDTVNLAARLEGTNKTYGTRILFSENTKKNLTDNIKYRLVDKVTVKGKTKAVEIYEALAIKN